jgi:hypothetical protein
MEAMLQGIHAAGTGCGRTLPELTGALFAQESGLTESLKQKP